MPNKIGRYEILKQIGEGGMAVVYLAHDPHFDREVALKMMSAELLARDDPSFRLRFQREAKIIAALEHPAIVPVYDFGEKNGNPYLVMRYMAGGSLEDRLRGGVLPVEEACRILNRLAPALDQAHRKGIIHRDLKPGNILFDQDDEPYISDFGMAKLTTAHTPITMSSLAIGTPAYMSPEQIQGDPDLDGRSDIYSLGAILFQMLSGVIPYQASTPAAQIVKHVTEPVPDIRLRRPDLPAGVQAVISCAMAKSKEARFRTVKAMVQALEDAIREGGTLPPMEQPAPSIPAPPPEIAPTPTPAPTGDPVPLQPAASAERPVRPANRKSWLWPVLAVITVLTLILVVQVITNRQGLRRILGMLQPSTATVTPSAVVEPSPLPPSVTPLPTTSPIPQKTATVTPLPPSATFTVTSSPTPMVTPTALLSSMDQAILLLVPAGEFTMGSNSREDLAAWKDEMPRHPVLLDEFYIYQTEVTNAMYALCVQSKACEPPDKTSSYHVQGYYGNLAYANYPVVYVSWFDASSYCQWAGGRLPTEAEWEKAARGTDRRLYPWGDAAPDVSRANYNVLVNDTTPVGSYPAGASFYGAFDMAGNVWEWVKDNYREDYYDISPLQNPQWLGFGLDKDKDRDDFRVARGGGFRDGEANLRVANRQKFYPVTHLYDIGFRCVR